MKKQTAMIFSAGLFLIAIAFFFIFMYNDSGKKDGSIVMPQDSAQIEDETDIAKKNQRLLEEVEVNKNNVKSVISLLARPKSYKMTASVKYFYGEENTEFTADMQVLGGFSHVSVFSGGRLQREMIVTPTHFYSWGEIREAYYKGPRGEMTYDDAALMPTFETVLEIEDSSLISASAEMYEGKLCICVKTAYEQGRFEREWYVDVDSGLLYACTAKENGTVIYTMTRAELLIELQDTDNFLLPSGVMPEGFEG